MKRRKQHKISMLAMEKLIEELYKPYPVNAAQSKDVPSIIEIEQKVNNIDRINSGEYVPDNFDKLFDF